MKEVIQNLLKNRLEELLKDRVIETLPIEIRVDHSKDKTISTIYRRNTTCKMGKDS